jgi:hypothetical protein
MRAGRQRMRLLAALLAFLGVLVPAFAQGMPPLASGPGERILAFDADITVAGNGDLHVVESIRFRVNGEQIKRGIIRMLGSGSSRSHEVISVTRDGHDEPFTVETVGDAMEVRIGNPDVLLTPGDTTYQVTYKAAGQVMPTGGTNTLAWNVTGDGWAFGIDSASAAVHLPGGASASALKLVTGPRGSTNSGGVIEQPAPGAVTARISRPLPAGSGMTIVVEWPAPAGAKASSPPDSRRTLDGMIQFYTILGYVFVLPLAVLVL